VALLAIAALAMSAMAAPVSILVQNPSFESPPVGPGLPVALTTDNWTLNGSGTLIFVPGFGNVPGGAGVFPNPPNPGGGPPPGGGPYSNGHLDNVDGSQAAYIFSNPGNSISQALVDPANSNAPITFAAGMKYTLTIGAALAQSAPPPTDRLAVQLFYSDGSGNHVVLNGIMTGAGAGLNQQALIDFGATSGVLGAADPAVGKQINVLFAPLDNGGGEFDLDNVRLVADVPEPRTLGMIGVGGGAALLMRRRRQRAG
jgi:hypothetical protein